MKYVFTSRKQYYKGVENQMKLNIKKSGILLIGSLCILCLTCLTMCKKKPKTEQVITQTIQYTHGQQALEGYLAYVNNANGVKKPGILVIHEWTGLGTYIETRTRMLGELGYVAFAMDMYGKGIRAKTHQEASKLMNQYMKQPDLMLDRIMASLELLKRQSNVDPNNIAIIGYCFGGYAALKMAYTGAKFKGIITFHAVIPSLANDEAKKILTPLLIHHGKEDSFTSADTLKAFTQNLEANNVNFTFISYPNAVHGFTKFTMSEAKSKSISYNKQADQKSWQSMQTFLNKQFSL